jgi:hypothetical protein
MAAQAKEEEGGRSWPKWRRRDEAGQNHASEDGQVAPPVGDELLWEREFMRFVGSQMDGKKELGWIKVQKIT